MLIASNSVYILLGGNLLDVKRTFEMAVAEISEKAGEVVRKSPLYKSAAWGFDSEDDFLNQVIEVKTDLRAAELLTLLLDIEQHLGRTRNPNTKGFSSRIIDIDILYFNEGVIKLPHLTIPHYAIQDRMFTLLPLNDLIPNYTHPLLKKTNAQLLADCNDKNIPVRV